MVRYGWYFVRCRTFVILILVCAISAFRTPLSAQEPSNPTALSLEELLDTKVYSASKYEQKVAEAPSSIVVISADQIRKYGYRTLMDVLATLPGFYVVGHGNYRSLGVRGFSPPGNANSRILLQVNGHALNSNIDDSAPLDDSFPIDMDLVDRIEIVRGPSSSLYGADAFFAVVNVITRTGKNKGAMVSGEGGSLGTYKETVAYGLDHTGTQALFSETYNLTNAPGRLDGMEDPIASTHNSDQGRRLFMLLSSHNFTLQGAVSGLQQRNPESATWCGACHQTDGHSTSFRGYADLQYDHPIGHGVEMTAHTYYDSAAQHGMYNDLRGCSAATCHGSVYDHDTSHGDWMGAELKFTKRFLAGHRLTVGTEYRDNFRQDQQNWIDGYADSTEGPVSTSQTFVDYDRASHLWGLYGEAELHILSKLILNLGLRNDRYNYVAAKTDPRAALIYSPRQSTTIKFLYGTAFRPPSFSEMYYAGMSSASAPLLRPETIRTEEIVFEQKLGKRTTIDASGFYNLIGNYIEQQTNIIDGGEDQTTFVNSKATAKGVELELKSKLSSGLEGEMSYTFQDVKNPLTDSSLPDSPRNLGKMRLGVPLFHQFLTSSIEAQYQSRSLATYPFASLVPTQDIGGLSEAAFSSPPVSLNLTLLSRELWRGCSLSASAYNLVGRPMSDPLAGYWEQTHLVAGNSLLPEDRRTFRVKLMWTPGGEGSKRKAAAADKPSRPGQGSNEPSSEVHPEASEQVRLCESICTGK
jgi:outer membrane receptor for ferrienterochelin and colicins